MEMRYFTYELIAAANGWIDQTEKDAEKAERRFWETVESYNRALDELKPRLSRRAYEFFRYGFAETALHDASLLMLRTGDAMEYRTDGKEPLRLNRKKASAQIEFLNYEQDSHYLFDVRGMSRVSRDLFVEDLKNFGDLYTYEIVEAGDEHLQLGFLFASGATIITRFDKLVFKKRKIRREYPVGHIYS